MFGLMTKDDVRFMNDSTVEEYKTMMMNDPSRRARINRGTFKQNIKWWINYPLWWKLKIRFYGLRPVRWYRDIMQEIRIIRCIGKQYLDRTLYDKIKPVGK